MNEDLDDREHRRLGDGRDAVADAVAQRHRSVIAGHRPVLPAALGQRDRADGHLQIADAQRIGVRVRRPDQQTRDRDQHQSLATADIAELDRARQARRAVARPAESRRRVSSTGSSSRGVGRDDDRLERRPPRWARPIWKPFKSDRNAAE